MDKIITALFQLLVDNKSTTPLFTVLAGVVALWAISGGASNLFGATALKKLEASELTYKTNYAVCQKHEEELEDELDDLEDDVDILKLQVSQLKNLNQILKLFLEAPPEDRQLVLDTHGIDLTLPTEDKPQSTRQ